MEACAAELGDATRFFQLYWSTLQRPRRELRAARRGVRVQRAGHHARHDDARLAHPRPRPGATCRSCAARASRSTRATRCSTASSPARAARRGRAPLPDPPQPKPTPAAIKTLVELTRAYPDRFGRALTSGKARAAVQTFVRIYSRPTLTWDDLAFVRERTSLPIVLKGILHPDDARRALDVGMDGIWVSNHGGRQVDGATRRSPRCRASPRRSTAACRSSWTAGSAPAPTRSRRSRWAPRRSGSGGPSATRWRSPARPACASCIENFQADFDLTMGLAGCRSVGRDRPRGAHAQPELPAQHPHRDALVLVLDLAAPG